MPNKLPAGWQEKKIIDISEVTSSKRIYEKEYVKNGVPFYRGKEISLLKNKEKIEEVIYISEEKYIELKNKYGVPQKNDILITAVGTIGNAYMVDNNDPFYFKDGNLIWLKDIKEYPKFLTFLFEYNQNKIIEISMGSSQKALTIIKLENLSFYFPPIDEQKRIADILSLCDDAIENLNTLIEKKELYKKGVMQKVLTGEVRFKGFKDEWQTVKLGDVLSYEQPNDYIVKNDEYNDRYECPVLTAGKTFILGYTDEKFGIYNKLPVIIFDDFTTETKYVNFPFKVKSSAMKILSSNKYNLKLIYELIKMIKFNAESHKRYWISEYQYLEIKIPKSIEEQKKIAELLSVIDEDIDNLKKLLELRKQQKKGLMQRLLTGEIRV